MKIRTPISTASPELTSTSPASPHFLSIANGAPRTESLPGALPLARNSPLHPPYGLYPEKLSGSAFTAPRSSNKQSWLYRILPSACSSSWTPLPTSSQQSPPTFTHTPNQQRWDPFPFPSTPTDFISSLRTLAGAGTPPMKNGLEVQIYTATADMGPTTAFSSSDGDLLIVPQSGSLDITTEFGKLLVRPTEIAVIPRGIRFRVSIPDGKARGYILETFSHSHYELPELGPIGSNGLANGRDFQVPTADYTDDSQMWTLVVKQDRVLYSAQRSGTPFDVVAWHGSYYPFKYDLNRFNTIGSISYDHPDPSIFTVLTLPSHTHPGTALADFVVFPPRWLVAEKTFRPPWFHRNCMSEYMGLICGGYDAKTGGGFVPGGGSLHNVMSGHGPDGETVEKETGRKGDAGVKVGGDGSMAFMFESYVDMGVVESVGEEVRQKNYVEHSWGAVRRRFNKEKRDWKGE